MTLMELTIVLVTVGIMAAMAAPMIDVFKPAMNAATLEVSTTLTTAQRTAVLRQHDVVVMFDTTRSMLRVHSDQDNSGEVETGEPVKWVALEDGTAFGKGQAPAVDSRTGDITFKAVQNGYPAITFHRNGSASEEGIAYITSLRNATAAAAPAEYARAIWVQRATGQVACLRYRSSGWEEAC